MSSFQRVSEAIRAKGLFCSLYADRASQSTGTRPRPAARWARTPRPRSAAPWRMLGIELIPAYSPEARGRSERMFGTLLSKRLP